MPAGEAATTEAIGRLRAAGCVYAEEEAAMLAAEAADDRALARLVRRRAGGEPLEQVVGYADFCGIRVRLCPGVFVPRVRSELLVRLAAQVAGACPAAKPRARTQPAGADRPTTVLPPAATPAAGDGDRGNSGPPAATPAAGSGDAGCSGRPVVLDLGCGSGALGLAVLRLVPHIELVAADVDATAVACAGDNFGPHRNQVFAGHLFTALPARLRGRIDVVLANVPYVATRHLPLLPAEARLHEPVRALDGGPDGLEVFRAMVRSVPPWLAPGGTVLSEITRTQVTAAEAAVRAAGLRAQVHHDDELDATVIAARR